MAAVHSSPQETCCIRYAAESMELELDRLHKACIPEEVAQAVQTRTRAGVSGPMVAGVCESGSAGGNLDWFVAEG